MRVSFAIAALASIASAQQVGTQKTEYHAPLNLGNCTVNGGCQTERKSVTMDANWRWTHKTSGYDNCYEGTSWDMSVCSDGLQCAKNCAIDGVDSNDLKNTYGVTAGNGNDLQLGFVTYGGYSKNVGSRMYMMADDSNYEMFKLKGREFTFDVDVSQLPCGINGALYFVEMSQNGDQYQGNNAAGAKFGTGYCDAQCPHDVKFMNGEANVEDWDTTTGMGKKGSCCAEMDIWEANSMSSAYTLHPCGSLQGQHSCNSATECGDGDDGRYSGVCDKDGCDLNAYRAGQTNFYGQGKTVNTQQPFTVVTQFLTADGTANTDIVEVKRAFVQNGQFIPHVSTKISDLSEQYDSITDDMCNATKEVFGDLNDYKNKGSMKSMSDALGRGVVLVMSLWDDHAANMLWLDSTYPTDSTHAGAARGSCSITSGNADEVESQSPYSYVKYSNIRVGEIGSTYAQNLSTEFLQ